MTWQKPSPCSDVVWVKRFFTGLHSHFDCLYLTRVFQARCEPRKKLKLTMLMSVCGHTCAHMSVCMNVWCRHLANMSAIFFSTGKNSPFHNTAENQRQLPKQSDNINVLLKNLLLYINSSVIS